MDDTPAASAKAACDRFANLHHPDPAAEAVFNAVIRAAEQPVWATEFNRK